MDFRQLKIKNEEQFIFMIQFKYLNFSLFISLLILISHHLKELFSVEFVQNLDKSDNSNFKSSENVLTHQETLIYLIERIFMTKKMNKIYQLPGYDRKFQEEIIKKMRKEMLNIYKNMFVTKNVVEYFNSYLVHGKSTYEKNIEPNKKELNLDNLIKGYKEKEKPNKEEERKIGCYTNILSQLDDTFNEYED